MENASQEKLPILQIGAGFWGATWARLLVNSPWATLAGLVDHNAERLGRISEELRLPSARRFRSLDDALQSTDAIAALIVVPPAAHCNVALQAIESGLHCLVEKPFTPTLNEARQVVDHAARHQRRVMVAQTYRFRRGPATVQRLIEQASIGRIGSVQGRLAKELHLDLSGWREKMDEPIIVDQAVHHFDFIRGIFQLEPTRVRAHSFNPSWSWFRGNASAAVDFETDGGCYISYYGSWVSRGRARTNTTFEGSWELDGERGAIVWEHNRVSLVPTDIGDVIFHPYALEREGEVLEVPLLSLPAEDRMGVLSEFVSAVRGNREPRCSGADNIRTLALVLAAEAATKTNGWLNIGEFATSV